MKLLTIILLSSSLWASCSDRNSNNIKENDSALEETKVAEVVWSDDIECIGMGQTVREAEVPQTGFCAQHREEFHPEQVEILKNLSLVDYASIADCESCNSEKIYFLDVTFKDGTFKRYYDNQSDQGSDINYIDRAAIFDLSTSGDLCENLVGKSFSSKEEVIINPLGPVMGHDIVSFGDLTYTYVHTDIAMTAFFICNDGSFVGASSSEFFVVDAENLIWEGIEYELIN